MNLCHIPEMEAYLFVNSCLMWWQCLSWTAMTGCSQLISCWTDYQNRWSKMGKWLMSEMTSPRYWRYTTQLAIEVMMLAMVIVMLMMMVWWVMVMVMGMVLACGDGNGWWWWLWWWWGSDDICWYGHGHGNGAEVVMVYKCDHCFSCRAHRHYRQSKTKKQIPPHQIWSS